MADKPQREVAAGRAQRAQQGRVIDQLHGHERLDSLLALPSPFHAQQLGAQQNRALFLRDLRPHNDVDCPRLVLEGRKDDAFRCARPLAVRHDPARSNRLAILCALPRALTQEPS